MCGIFGYSGGQQPSKLLLEGLRRLEYRGYDSWGICFERQDEKVVLNKNVGKIPKEIEKSKNRILKPFVKTESNPEDKTVDQKKLFTGIAHTRWATHGGVTQKNAHPHVASDNTFALAQNGIVENYQELKDELLQKGYKFISETDTEVIVRLIEEIRKQKNLDLFDAIVEAFKKLKGRNTIIIKNILDDEIIAIKNGSPLVVGHDKASDEFFIGSDYLSFSNYTNNILEIPDNHGIRLFNNSFAYYKIGKRSIVQLKAKFHEVEVIDQDLTKGAFEDYMLKEISEQPQTVISAIGYTKQEFEPLIEAIKKADRVYTVGCGTAGYAAGQLAYYLRKHAQKFVTELRGYEMDSYKELFTKKDLLIAISQSGETADTLEAVEYMQKAGGKVASIVNMLGSTLTKISDYSYFSRTGPEICVASTKAFTAQVAWSYLLTQTLIGKYKQGKKHVEEASQAMQTILDSKKIKKTLEDVVKYLEKQEHAFILGRGQNYYLSLEGALKVKEIPYKHVEGFTAGELKHGPIALIEEGTPVFVIISDDEAKDDMLSAAAEVKARGAKVIAISYKANDLFDYCFEVGDVKGISALVNVLPFQLISYYLGKALGNDVDRPRNLAKSVTVK